MHLNSLTELFKIYQNQFQFLFTYLIKLAHLGMLALAGKLPGSRDLRVYGSRLPGVRKFREKGGTTSEANACKYSRLECTLIFEAQMQIITLCSLSLPPSQHYECTLSLLHTQHYEEGESVNLHLSLKNKSAL